MELNNQTLMSVPVVAEFFNNKVNIQLKSGQRFEGLLNRIDYKTKVVVLEDVEDLGNELDKNFMPHDKKIPEKSFEAENINEIFMKDKHFSEPKKYKKEDFWDSTTEAQPQKDRKYRPKFEEGKKDYKPRINYQDKGEGRNYEDRGGRNYENNRGGRNYQDRGNYKPREEAPYRKHEDRKEPKEEEDERGLR